MNQNEAIELSKDWGWTVAEAKRALEAVSYPIEEVALLKVLTRFAGAELKKRQYLQAAQKAQVTKKANHIEKIETDFSNQISTYQETLEKERSLFVAVIRKLYKLAKPFGLQDPWIDALLVQYDQYQKDAA
jgi:hypothetical protein